MQARPSDQRHQREATALGNRLQPAIEPQGRRGSKRPDRNAQFEHINAKVIAARAAGQPVISVDTKEKELIGNYKNGDTDYRPKGDPQCVKVHDFEDKELGKVLPYGVYDVGANAGWVSVGITSKRHGRVRCRLDPQLARSHGA